MYIYLYKYNTDYSLCKIHAKSLQGKYKSLNFCENICSYAVMFIVYLLNMLHVVCNLNSFIGFAFMLKICALKFKDSRNEFQNLKISEFIV